jgi:hypothetical protein
MARFGLACSLVLEDFPFGKSGKTIQRGYGISIFLSNMRSEVEGG